MTEANYSRFKFLKIEKEDGIATLTLNRPEQRNSLSPAAQLELEHVWLDLGKDKEVQVIILTGAGKAFSAGGDIKHMIERFGTEEGFKFTLNQPEGTKRLLQNILDVPQPIIAAVNGDAVGLGATLALFADISVIADNAKFGDTHVKVGIVAGDGGTVIWPLLIGANRAKEFLMLGRLASGSEAASMGLMNHSVPPEQVMEKALEIAQDLRALAPLAVQWTKASINKSIKDQLNLLLDAAIAFEMLSMNSQDHLEASTAFFEKRAPVFKGF
jgi:enoyl-CoA hydratase